MSDSGTPLQLLQVCDLAKQWPTLGAIHDLAMADLVKMNDDAKAELAKRAEVKAKADAEAAAKAAAEAKARADEQAANDKAMADAQTQAAKVPASGPRSVTQQ